MMTREIGLNAYDGGNQFPVDPVSRFDLLKSITVVFDEFLPFFNFGVHTQSSKIPGSIVVLVIIDLLFHRFLKIEIDSGGEFGMFHAEAARQTIPRELRS